MMKPPVKPLLLAYHNLRHGVPFTPRRGVVVARLGDATRPTPVRCVVKHFSQGKCH